MRVLRDIKRLMHQETLLREILLRTLVS